MRNGSTAERFRARLGIVTPWFGFQLSGGAEQQSWQLAHHLANAGYLVDVLTTCCASFNDDWAHNALPAGTERSGNIVVKRFRVDKRDRRAFARVNAVLMGLRPEQLKRSVSPIGEDEARVFEEDNINSSALLRYLAADGASYRALVFIPYLYGPTLAALPSVSDRAWLQPCLHNEPYAYLPAVRRTAHAARGILFNSAGELELAVSLFGPGIIKKSTLVGQGVEIPNDSGSFAERIGNFVPHTERYVLYLGRQDPRKNVGLLVHAFGEFRRRHPMSRLKLVLAGERSTSYGDTGKGIVDLGRVDETEKAALLAHSLALVQPSTMESYSRVMMESWLHGRPVVVNEQCEATATVVRETGGGLLAGTVSSWESMLYYVDVADSKALDAMGERGRLHALHSSSWPKVIEAYERALGLRVAGNGPRPRGIETIRQFSAGSAPLARYYADALTRTLERAQVRSFLSEGPLAGGDDAPLVVHHTCGVVEEAAPLPARGAALICHPEAAASEQHQLACRATLSGAVASYGTAFGSTPSTVAELQAVGFDEARFLPICVDPRDWDCDDDRPLAKALQDGCTNLVYVGPFNELEALDQLLTTFLHYLALDRDSRLVLIARGAVDDAIYGRVSAKVRSLDLVDRVLLARDITEPQLQSVYRCAHLFWSLDEGNSLGEGFLQAMWFDVPIIAYKTDVSTRLVGDAGLLIADKSDLMSIATLAQIVVTDGELRRRIVRAQRTVRARFDAETIARDLLDRLAVPEPECQASPITARR